MSDRLYVATRKGLFTLDRRLAAKPQWIVSRAAFVGENLSIVFPDQSDGSVYAAADHGHFGVKLHRSNDGGNTFVECSAPAYPPKPENDPPDLCPMRHTPIPWNVELIWALEGGGHDQPGVLWCGTIPGGLFRSADRGATWELIRPLWDDPRRRSWFGGGRDHAGIHSICVDPRDSRRVAVGVSCGGVWVTTDGGASWDCKTSGMWAAYMPPERKFEPQIQDPHCLVQCRARPEAFWVQHHNGVFRSIDGAESWHEVPTVKPSTFGFAVAVHPSEPDTAWFVPGVSDEKRVPVEGKVVVARTRDGGRNFDVLSEGLPQHFAYDLVFRHALDVDPSGERLAFGSTTGSLWISENQGDSWQLVTAHLPPVHCVRFCKLRSPG